ncbi:G1/S-specific cyclin-E1 [Paramecium bursaria]
MKKYSLNFKDDNLEKEFTQILGDQNLQPTILILTYFACLTFLMFLVRIIQGDYKLSWISFCVNLILMYLIRRIKRDASMKQYLTHLLQNLSLISSIIPLIVYIQKGQVPYAQELLQNDICMIGSICFIRSQNFKRNTLYYFIFIFCRSYRHFQDGIKLINFIFILSSLMLVFYDYISVFTKRKYFLLFKSCEIQFKIFQKYSKEKIMIFQFDQDLFKFQTIQITDCLQNVIKDLGCTDILREIQLINQKLTLKSYLYRKFVEMRETENIIQHLKGKLAKKFINLELIVQNIVDQIFVLRINDPQLSEKTNFYKKLLNKLRQVSYIQKVQQIVDKEVLKNTITTFALQSNKRVKYQINILNFEIYNTLQEIFPLSMIYCQKISIISSDILLFKSSDLNHYQSKTFRFQTCILRHLKETRKNEEYLFSQGTQKDSQINCLSYHNYDSHLIIQIIFISVIYFFSLNCVQAKVNLDTFVRLNKIIKNKTNQNQIRKQRNFNILTISYLNQIFFEIYVKNNSTKDDSIYQNKIINKFILQFQLYILQIFYIFYIFWLESEWTQNYQGIWRIFDILNPQETTNYLKEIINQLIIVVKEVHPLKIIVLQLVMIQVSKFYIHIQFFIIFNYSSNFSLKTHINQSQSTQNKYFQFIQKGCLMLFFFFRTLIIINKHFIFKKQATKRNLQLLGLTSLFISCKIEEIYPRKVSDFEKAADFGYTSQQILDIELIMLRVNNYFIGHQFLKHHYFYQIHSLINQLFGQFVKTSDFYINDNFSFRQNYFKCSKGVIFNLKIKIFKNQIKNKYDFIEINSSFKLLKIIDCPQNIILRKFIFDNENDTFFYSNNIEKRDFCFQNVIKNNIKIYIFMNQSQGDLDDIVQLINKMSIQKDQKIEKLLEEDKKSKDFQKAQQQIIIGISQCDKIKMSYQNLIKNKSMTQENKMKCNLNPMKINQIQQKVKIFQFRSLCIIRGEFQK